MRLEKGFLRKAKSGKYVGVVKYKDDAGAWRQKSRTFTRDRAESEALLAAWRAELAALGACAACASPGSQLGTPDRLTAAAAPSAVDAVAPRAVDAAAPGVTGGPTAASGLPGVTGGSTAASGLPDATERAASPAAGGPTVEQAVRACLAAQLARGRIERSTHDMQLAFAGRSLFPHLGSVPLAALTPALAQAWVDRLCLELAPGSVRIAYSTLRKTCARAAAQGALAANPLERVELPARTRPARAYLPGSSVRLLEAALDQEHGPASGLACATRLALLAGLRAGECCALRWRDVDLARGRLRVAASVGRADGGLYLKAPKCPASVREFPVVAPLVSALQARSRATQQQSGQPPRPDRFVCGPYLGEQFANPRSLSNAFARLCERAGVTDSDGRRATFHALRHTFATRAVHAGVDVRTLADLLGHARADVTLNVYAATSEDAKLAAVARLEGALRDRPPATRQENVTAEPNSCHTQRCPLADNAHARQSETERQSQSGGLGGVLYNEQHCCSTREDDAHESLQSA